MTSPKRKPKGQGAGAPAAGWRATLPVHPAADLFPRMSSAEVKALAEDIKAQGLISPIALWQADPDAPLQLLDGISRLVACEIIESPVWVVPPEIRSGPDAADPVAHGGAGVVILDGRVVDPYEYVAAANLKRRHLTTEQKRDLVAALLKAQPEKSNRQIAEMAKRDDKTVGSIRRELEERAEIPHVETRTDKRGRAQPAKKAKRKKAPDPPPTVSDEILRSRAAAAARIRELMDGSLGPRSDVDDPDADDTPPPSTGPNSPKQHLDYVKFLRMLPEDRCFEVLKRLCADVSDLAHGFTLSVKWDDENPQTGGGSAVN